MGYKRTLATPENILQPAAAEDRRCSTNLGFSTLPKGAKRRRVTAANAAAKAAAAEDVAVLRSLVEERGSRLRPSSAEPAALRLQLVRERVKQRSEVLNPAVSE